MSDSRPNILFFFTDDQRFNTIRALGNDEIITPNIDALVRRGTAFTNAYIMGGTNPAVCMPSRAMLMSGRTLFHLDREGQDVPADHRMFPEVLRESGYTTFGTGKWHNGPGSYARCFSTGDRIFFGGMSEHFEVPLNDFDPSGRYPEEAIRVEDKRHSSDLFSDSIVDFLRSHDDNSPFCAYLAFTAPHDPRDTHQKYHDMYDPDTVTLPDNFMAEHPFDNGEMRIRDELLAPWPRTPEVVRQHLAAYYAMITHLDDQVGRVMNALDESGHLDDTIVVFAGDNGLAVGEHGLMGKQNLYDHSVHVPLILGGPGVPQGTTSDAFAYLIDIYPTLFDLIGEPLPETVEGESLVPAMNDPDVPHRSTLFFAYRDIQRSVRDERYKLIEYAVNGERTTQLFDLQDDPFETNDLSSSHPERVGSLRKELRRWQQELDDPATGFDT